MRRGALLLFLVSLGSCAGKAPPLPPPVPPAASRETEVSLFLIGDAGEPREGGDPVLLALEAQIASSPGRVVAVFLGDNVYNYGLPPIDAEDRTEMERRLRDQIEAANGAERVVFVPGNHDWNNGKEGGWEAIRRQEEFIREHGDAGRIVLSPEGGCPGPRVLELGPELTLIAIDTHWWLHEREKPGPETCEPGTEEAVALKLRASLSSKKGKHAVVVAHHPLLSSGSHGGYFNWQDHLFPLTRAWKGLWLPLPGIGSLYPLARTLGATSQDLSSDENRHMREALEEAFRGDPPLVFAAGHEHTLEVLRGDAALNLLVSGAGYYGHTSPTKWRPETRYQKAASGFMRLDFLRSGGVRLGVLLVDRRGKLEEPFAIELP
jgi:hypothetical protein